MLTLALLAVVSAEFAGVAQCRADSGTWEYTGNGAWATVTAPTTKPVAGPEPQLDRAEQLLYRGGHADEAKKILVDWVKINKTNPSRDRCTWLLAEAFFQLDDRIKAFYYLDELLEVYPESKLFYPALEKQYLIADEYLKGHKIRFLGMALFSGTDEAIEMLYRVQQRSPGSVLAERALLRTADYYYADSEFDLARDAYGAYLRSYPRSPEVPRVRLRRAFSALAQFHGLKFDPTGVIDARAELVDITHDYPDMAASEHVPAVIARIDNAFARKILQTGEYYERVHDTAGAVYHYKYLVETFPDEPEAATARQRLARLPDVAGRAAPPPGDGYAPSTQPTAAAQ
jgi:outer membrane assembly lipoprotein YfiO